MFDGIVCSAVPVLSFEAHTGQSETDVCVFVVSTYEDGSAPESSQGFFTWLSDIAT